MCAGILHRSTRWPAIPIWSCALPRLRISCASSAACRVPQLKEVARPYLEQIDRLQGKPVERARDMLLNALAQLSLREDTRAATENLLREMFSQTHDVDHAPVTQIFQEFVIGSKLYAESYQLPPRFAAPSVLTTEDRSLISAAAQAQTRGVGADRSGAGVRLHGSTESAARR